MTAKQANGLQMQVYRLMDSIIIETDKPRTLHRLNEDRHIFVDAIMQAFQNSIDELMLHEKIEPLISGQHIVSDSFNDAIDQAEAAITTWRERL